MSRSTRPAPVLPIRAARDSGVDSLILLQDWQRWMTVRGLSDKTIRLYRRYLVELLASTCKPFGDIIEEDVLVHVEAMAARGPSRTQAITTFRLFFRWATERGYVQANPVRDLRPRAPKVGPAPSLSTEELTRLIIAAAAEGNDPRRPWAILLCFATGARNASLCAVRPEDVDLQRGRIHFRTTKWNRPYSVPLGRLGTEAARELLELQDFRPRLVGHRLPTLLGVGPAAFWNWVNKAAKAAHIAAWPHLLRHTFATELAEAHVDPDVLRELMNHQDYSQLRRYIRTSEVRTREAVELLDVLGTESRR